MPVEPRESPRARPLLSVVIPTRNRAAQVRRLLLDLRRQSLADAQFEVVVVDDGSDPVLRPPATPFALTLLRRDEDHGAHASRAAGLRAARAERVLFLDDDVEPSSEVLSMHAAAGPRIALGPIAYSPRTRGTPYQRYMARFYASCNEALAAPLAPGDFWICNASSPRTLWLSAFERLRTRHAGEVIGGGFDEGLIAEVMAELGEVAVPLPAAMIWHVDDKTFDEGLGEARASSEATARALSRGWYGQPRKVAPDPVRGGGARAIARRTAMRAYWAAPWLFGLLAVPLAALVRHGPAELVPAGACRVPLTLAHWAGWRAVYPDFAIFEATTGGRPREPESGVWKTAKRRLREGRLTSGAYGAAARAWHWARCQANDLAGRRSHGPAEFERLFDASDDPWGYRADPVAAGRRELILGMLGERNGRLLEVGCATGWLTRELASHASEVHAIDVSERAIAQARAECAGLAHVSFERIDVLHELPRGRFDTLVCAGVLVYLPRAAQQRVRDGLVALLAVGGRLLLEHTQERFPGETAGAEIHALYARHPGLEVVRREARDIYEVVLLARR